MNYVQYLEKSAKEFKNITCMGLDVQTEVLPYQTGNIREDIFNYFSTLFHEMKKRNLIPSAFKPNIGYYASLDKPREKKFDGSLVLSDILDLLDKIFPGVPVILDSKRGDIARSSLNYAIEAFDNWKADAVTVSPYMGTDSVIPFAKEGKGIYVLDRTSNPGGKDLQNLLVLDKYDEKEMYPLYLSVAHTIVKWAKENPGIGAVVGATNMAELSDIASYYGKKGIPMLIPGVGSQGGSAPEVMEALRNAGYSVELARINSSSGLTHPWKKGRGPENWLALCIEQIEKLLKETQV